MKRLNPKTGKHFSRGDIRDDGFIFKRYILSRPIRANGTFVEEWVNPERTDFGTKRINPLTQKIFKMGDISECGHYKFHRYASGNDKNGYSYEDWIAIDEYSNWRDRHNKRGKIHKRKIRVLNSKQQAPKRINPETGETFTRGEIFQGKRFIHYTNSTVKNGYMGEEWTDEEGWFSVCVNNTMSNRRKAAKEKAKTFDLTSEYLHSIFPKDNLCPIFKVPLVWGGNKDNSPSLDCVIPDLGYVEENVAWISTRANVMKLTRSPYNLRKIADWIDNELAKLSKIK